MPGGRHSPNCLHCYRQSRLRSGHSSRTVAIPWPSFWCGVRPSYSSGLDYFESRRSFSVQTKSRVRSASYERGTQLVLDVFTPCISSRYCPLLYAVPGVARWARCVRTSDGISSTQARYLLGYLSARPILSEGSFWQMRLVVGLSCIARHFFFGSETAFALYHYLNRALLPPHFAASLERCTWPPRRYLHVPSVQFGLDRKCSVLDGQTNPA